MNLENSKLKNMNQHPLDYLPEEQIALEQARFISQVYTWMTAALLLTGLTAYGIASSPTLMSLLIAYRSFFLLLLLAEVLLVGYLSAMVMRMSLNLATLLFFLYAVFNGITLSFIFITYTASSIASTFFITAGTFAVMSIYGYTTKSDLTRWGNLFFMVLVGLVLATLVNLFLQSPMIYWITTYVGVCLFVGLIAYDTQKIKEMNIIGNEGTDEDRKEAILGALTLYLDFINLFIYLLRLFGRRE